MGVVYLILIHVIHEDQDFLPILGGDAFCMVVISEKNFFHLYENHLKVC